MIKRFRSISTNKYLPFALKKIIKIGPVDPQIIDLMEIIKKERN